MVRSRSYDEDEVLTLAMHAFRREGYSRISIPQLETATGLSSGSIYNSFGDKRALFVKALNRYLDRSLRARLKRLEEAHVPRQVIPAFFAEVIDRSLNDRTRGGCLLINSVLEISPHDPKLGRQIAAYVGEIEEFFRRTIYAAQADGSVAASLDAKDAARLREAASATASASNHSEYPRSVNHPVVPTTTSLVPASDSAPSGR